MKTLLFITCLTVAPTFFSDYLQQGDAHTGYVDVNEEYDEDPQFLLWSGAIKALREAAENPNVHDGGRGWRVGEHVEREVLHSEGDRFRIWIYDDFFSHSECEYLIRSMNESYQPCDAIPDGERICDEVNDVGALPPSIAFNDTFLALIKRIDTIMMPSSVGGDKCHRRHERGDFQFVRYRGERNHKFSQHFDKFDDNDDTTLTAMVYCSGGGEDSGTFFPRKNVTIGAKVGRAVFWRNCVRGRMDRRSIHAGRVGKGLDKYIINRFGHSSDPACCSAMPNFPESINYARV